jgi:hypothetical protein
MAEFHPLDWAEKHPLETGLIVFGGGLVLLWMFGFFGGSAKSSSDGGQTNMAAAYYAAEAAQTTAGAQLQMATVEATNQTAQVQLQSQAAVAINQANATAQQAIAANGYSSATTIATTQSNDAMLTANHAADVQYATNRDNNASQDFLALVAPGGALPYELQTYGAGVFTLPQGQTISASSGFSSPASMRAQGYGEAQIAQFFRNQGM